MSLCPFSLLLSLNANSLLWGINRSPFLIAVWIPFLFFPAQIILLTGSMIFKSECRKSKRSRLSVHSSCRMFGTNESVICSLCTLLQTLHTGPMAAFLMHTKDNPMKVLGVLAVIIGVMVMIILSISTVTFWRNKRSPKIVPARRIIKKRQNYQPRTIKMEWLSFKKSCSNVATKFTVKEDTISLQNENSNNSSQMPSLPPPPPSAPIPLHAPVFKIQEPSWKLSTVSGSLSPKLVNKQARKKGVLSTHDTALVSELKQRFEIRNSAIGQPHI